MKAFWIALLALLVAPAVPAGAQEKVRLVVGGKAGVYYLPLSVAERLGYFKDAGVDVEISDVTSGGRALQSIVGGSADIGLGNFDHTIQMQAKGQPVVAVLQYGRYPGFVLAMMAGKADRYKSPADLKGMKIGVTSPGSATHFMAAYMLVRAGFKADDASFIGTGVTSTAVAAARRAEIDAMVSSDPMMTPDAEREPGEGRGRHAHARGHAGGLRRAVSGRRGLCVAGLHREESEGGAGRGRRVRARPALDREPFGRGHRQGDAGGIRARQPADLHQGAGGLEADVFGDGRFEPGAVETAYAVLKVFDPAVAAATIDLSKTHTDAFVTKGAALK